ncbi:acid-sensing ion channel 5-like isoform X2 [Clytia hemisphaerica]
MNMGQSYDLKSLVELNTRIVAEFLDQGKMVHGSCRCRERLMCVNAGRDDEEFLKEKQQEVEEYNKRIGDYVDGFTVHGLTKVFKGKKKESTVWMVFIFVGLLLAGVVIGRLVAKYYRFETYTEVKSVVTAKNVIPSISVCDFSELRKAYFSYCGTTLLSKDENRTKEYCDHSKLNLEALDNSTMVNGKWRNRLFEIEECYPWEGAKCNSPKYFKSHMLGACFTWNYDGEFHDAYGHVDFQFKYLRNSSKHRPDIIIIPHDPRISEIDLTKKITIDMNKHYEIKIGKTYMIRKPHPYSKCTAEATNAELDVFPGNYDRRTCRETYKQLNSFKECGDIFEYFKSYLPKSFIKKYAQNRTIGEMEMCILKTINVKPPEDLCPFPCEELSLNIHTNVYDGDKHNKDLYIFGIQLENVDTYTVMEEQSLYSAEQMSSEIGGFLGLVIGASLLSFVELFACGALYVLKKIKS